MGHLGPSVLGGDLCPKVFGGRVLKVQKVLSACWWVGLGHKAAGSEAQMVLGMVLTFSRYLCPDKVGCMSVVVWVLLFAHCCIRLVLGLVPWLWCRKLGPGVSGYRILGVGTGPGPSGGKGPCPGMAPAHGVLRQSTYWRMGLCPSSASCLAWGILVLVPTGWYVDLDANMLEGGFQMTLSNTSIHILELPKMPTAIALFPVWATCLWGRLSKTSRWVWPRLLLNYASSLDPRIYVRYLCVCPLRVNSLFAITVLVSQNNPYWPSKPDVPRDQLPVQNPWAIDHSVGFGPIAPWGEPLWL